MDPFLPAEWLPVIFAGLMGISILLYVVLDGLDLGIGLLSGGYGRDELERSGALRVYEDPADMLRHLDEIAPRPGEA